MNKWQELDIERKIIGILHDTPDADPMHHLGLPYLTAYQIAIEFARLYPDDAAQLDFPIGGADVGQRYSLAKYLAGQLSKKIRAGQLPQIEGGFLSNQHLNDISFHVDKETIHSSLTNTNFMLSMFRLHVLEGYKMNKYDPLHDFLLNILPNITERTLSFDEIEKILGDKLPNSATTHRAWWANPISPNDHPHAQSWITAGWKVDTVNQNNKWVSFTRV